MYLIHGWVGKWVQGSEGSFIVRAHGRHFQDLASSWAKTWDQGGRLDRMSSTSRTKGITGPGLGCSNQHTANAAMQAIRFLIPTQLLTLSHSFTRLFYLDVGQQCHLKISTKKSFFFLCMSTEFNLKISAPASPPGPPISYPTSLSKSGPTKIATHSRQGYIYIYYI